MSTNNTVTVTSTSDTKADGINGYRKSLGSFLAVVIAGVASAWADGSITSAEWGNIAILSASAAVAAFLLPNAVKPIAVAVPPTPAANLDVEDDTPGDHAIDNPNRTVR